MESRLLQLRSYLAYECLLLLHYYVNHLYCHCFVVKSSFIPKLHEEWPIVYYTRLEFSVTIPFSFTVSTLFPARVSQLLIFLPQAFVSSLFLIGLSHSVTI